MPFLKDGRLLAVAVTTPKRSPLLPDVPTVAEFFPKFDKDGAHSIMAPARTPLAIRTQISREVARILTLPDVKARLDEMGYNIAPSTPLEQDKIAREHIQSFADMGKRLGLIER
jgi:tripartite-type tricarboxylate transporter receptor subunit TctC